MSGAEAGVLAANADFYAAFRDRDAGRMDQLWATHHPVTCVHPGRRALTGRVDVMASWRAILHGETRFPIRCGDEIAFVLGDTAFVTCTEQLPGAELVATNIFMLENGAWKMVHHHASPLAALSSRPAPETLNGSRSGSRRLQLGGQPPYRRARKVDRAWEERGRSVAGVGRRTIGVH
jgi:ketosteroid isomerase-like protein